MFDLLLFILLQDGWLIFDTIIVVSSWSMEEVQIVRAFRIFRALRLITRIQVMQNLILGAFKITKRAARARRSLFLLSEDD